jgi:hypothetical protein
VVRQRKGHVLHMSSWLNAATHCAAARGAKAAYAEHCHCSSGQRSAPGELILTLHSIARLGSPLCGASELAFFCSCEGSFALAAESQLSHTSNCRCRHLCSQRSSEPPPLSPLKGRLRLSREKPVCCSAQPIRDNGCDDLKKMVAAEVLERSSLRK